MSGSVHTIHGLPETYADGPKKILRVLIHSAVNLAKKDIFGLSDPYVLFSLCKRSRSSNLKRICTYRTKTMKRTLNPVWKMEALFRVDPTRCILLFELFDNNRITRDDFLGLVEIPFMGTDIATLPLTEELVPTSYVLRSRGSGSVRGSVNIAVAFVAEGELGSTNSDLRRQSSTSATTNTRNTDIPDLDQDAMIVAVTDHRGSVINGAADALPEGWEARHDANGRIYYVDHGTRTISSTRPAFQRELSSVQAPTSASQPGMQEPISSTVPRDSTLSSGSAGAGQRHHFSFRDIEQHVVGTGASEATSVGSNIASPGDSVSTTASAARSIELLTTSEEEEPLPPGWQKARAPNGRIFYVDHNSQVTSWRDPRTGRETAAGSELGPPAAPLTPTRPENGSKSVDSTPGGRNSSSFSSAIDTPGQAATEAQVDEQLGPLPPGWERRLADNGRTFFVDHMSRKTTWEDPRLSRLASGPGLRLERSFKVKYDAFRASLRLPRGDLPPKLDVDVRRQEILQDSFNVIMSVKDPAFLKTRLWVSFRGEPGLDYSGVKREFFWLLSKHMFNPYYGLFAYSSVDNYTLQINANSAMAEPNHLQWFYFIGRVTGMAVYHGYLLDGFFVRPFYKLMLNRPLELRDMESVDIEYFQSLRYIIDNDDVATLELHFVDNETDLFGQPVVTELVANGADIPVTNENKRQYVAALIDHRLRKRVTVQMDAFMRGFSEFIPQDLLSAFDAHELELLIGGIQNIDVNDWREHTEYRGGYTQNHVTVVNFWKLVCLMSNHQKTWLLQWTTGTSKLPANGFKDLYGSNGPQKFTIQQWGAVDHLPQAHTCFNRLELPPYQTYDELREKLFKALELGLGFGVD